MNNIDPKILAEKDPKKLMESLSKEDKETVAKMLKDKKALAEILKSPQAQAIMKALSGKGKNGWYKEQTFRTA